MIHPKPYTQELEGQDGQPLSPVEMGGIYLPFDKAPEECVDYPLLLAYHGSHFTAVVTETHGKDADSGALPRQMDYLPITGLSITGEYMYSLPLSLPSSIPASLSLSQSPPSSPLSLSRFLSLARSLSRSLFSHSLTLSLSHPRALPRALYFSLPLSLPPFLPPLALPLVS